MLVIGLMSGTSADGVDAVLLELVGAPSALRWTLRAHLHQPHPPALRDDILRASRPGTSSPEYLCAINFAIAERFAGAVLYLCRQAGVAPSAVDLIGSHGQTIWHIPGASTLQLGEPAILAECIGITTIANFRPRDIAAGGQGAPLVAYVDQLLFSHPSLSRVCLNIGGIANITWLPARSQSDQQVLAYDTGPGNCLLDDAVSYLSGGRLTYDLDGALALAGCVCEDLLQQWIDAEPYFALAPPKTTGRELFSREYMLRLLASARAAGLTDADFMATLSAFTTRAIVNAMYAFLPRLPDELILSGGGARNPALVRGLIAGLPQTLMRESGDVGMPSDAKEAAAFAVLAYESWHNRPGNLPSATGAAHPVVLGSITPGSNYRTLLDKTLSDIQV